MNASALEIVWHGPLPAERARQMASQLPPGTTLRLAGPDTDCAARVHVLALHAQQSLASAAPLLAGENDSLWLVLRPDDQKHSAAQWLLAGADRCLDACVDEPTLLAMLRAMLRRLRGQTAAVSVQGPLQFEHDTQTLHCGEERVALTCRETQVADLLFQRGTQLVRSEELLRALGIRAPQPHHGNQVSLYVHRLNKKIRPYGVQVERLRGYGYRLQVQPAPQIRSSTNRPDFSSARPATFSWPGLAGS